MTAWWLPDNFTDSWTVTLRPDSSLNLESMLRISSVLMTILCFGDTRYIWNKNRKTNETKIYLVDSFFPGVVCVKNEKSHRFLTTWWQPAAVCLPTALWLPDDCLSLMTTWWLPNDCKMTAWQLYRFVYAENFISSNDHLMFGISENKIPI